MIMEPFEVYRYYLALRLHFTTEKYNVVEQQGRVKASKQAFLKRNDLHSIRKLADTYKDEEVVNFLVANFVSGDRWGGVFDSEARGRYLAWKKRIESISYIFEKEIKRLSDYCENSKIPFSSIFELKKDKHPYIIAVYLRQDISLETLVILDSLYPFVDIFDNGLKDDLIWPGLSLTLKKYKPFLTFKKEKYDRIFRITVRSA